MAVPCPQGVPQAACDAANGLLQAQGVNPQGWDSGNVSQTLQQWYASISKNNPNIPAVLPANAADYALPPFVNLLPSALGYWTGVAYKNPGIGGTINPTAWNFPWQYANPQSTGWYQTAVTSLGSMMSDPNAMQSLLKGQLPTFDPTKINWQQWGVLPIASDPQKFAQTANDVATLQPAMDAFLTKAGACGLLQKSAAEVQQALGDYLAFGVDPCSKVQPQPAPLPVPAPAPSPAPPLPVPVPPSTTPATTSNSTGLIVVGVVAAGAVGALLYMMAAKKRPTGFASEASEEAHQHTTWRGWNIVVEPHGRSWKAFAMHPTTSTTFRVSGNSSYDALHKVKAKIASKYPS